MRLRSACSLLLLLAAAPAASAPPAPTGLQLHDALPAGFQVDGKLDEWKLPVSVTLGAGNQVDGPSKPTSAQDLSAQLWLALGPEGLAVAGEVHDDRVQLPKKPTDLNADHVEVWLGLPTPQLPPIGFANQTGEHLLDNAAACEDNPALLVGEPGDCRRWLKQQTARQSQLLLPFSARYALMPTGVVKLGQKGKPVPVGSVHYEPLEGGGGYRFEALIPATLLPRSAQAPLKDVKVRVELIDSDERKGKRETVLASAPGRRAGDPGSFNTVALARPVRFGAWPDLFERALKANGSGSSYQPAANAASFSVWLNPARGNQYAPENPSPEAINVDMSKVDPHGSLGDLEVVTVPAQVERNGTVSAWLVSRRGQAVLDVQTNATRVVQTTPSPPGLRILEVFEEPRSALGIGVCPECPELRFQWLKMDAQGHFTAPEPLEGVASQGQEGVEWEAPPDLSRIEAFTGGAKGTPKQLALRYTWSPQTGRYEAQRF